MDYLQIVLLLLGLVFLVVGYRKNSRNILLSASLLILALYVSGDFGKEFMEGFMEGYNSSIRHSSE